MTLSSDIIINQTQCWISNVIVAYNFCPFAKRELERNRIFYQVSQASIIDDALETVISECIRLDSQSEIETAFVIYPDNFNDFSSFIELVELANALLVSEGYEGIYQIASFHPHYCFAESSQTDPANFTNRSPFPMLHLLRESSITQVLNNFPEPGKIPLQNIEKSRKLGNKVFQKILDDCTKITDSK